MPQPLYKVMAIHCRNATTVCIPRLLNRRVVSHTALWLKGYGMSKYEKYELWDRAFGFGPDNWKYAEWPTKDRATYYLKQCPGNQISDPDLPF